VGSASAADAGDGDSGELVAAHCRGGVAVRELAVVRGADVALDGEATGVEKLGEVAAGETPALEVDSTAMALYGAVRGLGEFVIASDDPDHAAITAADSFDRLLDGLAWG
jgi:hypothetical protein